MIITEFSIDEHALYLGSSLGIEQARQDQICELIRSNIRIMTDDKGTSEAQLLSWLNMQLSTLQELLYGTYMIDRLLNE